MTTSAVLLKSIQSSPTGLTLAGLLAQYPDLARRTVQRWLSQWVQKGEITASGEGRARRYDEVQALVVQELRRLHEGVLARYGLRPSELTTWKAAQHSR